jgi:hypothetical protein
LPTDLGEFLVDYDVNTDTTLFNVMRGDRSVTLYVHPIVDADQHLIRTESSITYGLYGPSLKRVRDGFRGELACDTSERVLPNATVEDLIVALQWLVGKGALAPEAREKAADDEGKEGP